MANSGRSKLENNMQEQIVSWLEQSCDFLLERKRYPIAEQNPAPAVIAHRGAWNTTTHPENTLKAFQTAKSLGLDGVELDVRFTKDGVPVVHHDPHLQRLFNDPGLIRELTFKEMQSRVPDVPTLEGVLALQGLHFMIEIKNPLSPEEIQTLAVKLSHLKPVQDFHLLVLDPELVRVTENFPARCWILVGQIQLRTLVEISIAHGYAGVAGHLLGMTGSLIARLHAHGQKAGAGFITSRNILNRERARGIDWAYTNTAESLKHE